MPSDAVYRAIGTPADGWLTSSSIDLSSSVSKRLDSVSLDSRAYQTVAGPRVRVRLQHDINGLVFDVTDDVTGEILENAFTQTTLERFPDLTMDQFLVRIDFTAPNSETFHAKTVVRLHPLGLVDELLQLNINCTDTPVGLGMAQLPGAGPRKGSERARALEALAETIVQFQDIDWRPGDPLQKWEVLSVSVKGRNTRQALNAQASQQLTALVTLRRFRK
jgi:hypothetical protein